MKRFMIIIYGPTGVGKTEFAEQLTPPLPIHMINMDVGQFYTPLSIGTAKPDLGALPFPYHLFNILDKPEHCTVTMYRSMLLEKLKKTWDLQSIPLLVGGSGFYLRSIFFPPQAQLAKEREADYNGTRDWDLLQHIDPQRAQEIDPQDTYRVKRALDIWFRTGKKPSVLKPVYDPPSSFFLLCLLRDRADLYRRIDERVEAMVNEGWIDEVASLMGTEWQPFIQEKKIIGYSEIASYLQSSFPGSRKELIAAIQKRTRNYAKRQLTFWRMLEQQIKQQLDPDSCNVVTSVNLTFVDVPLYIKQLVATIQSKVSE